MDLLDYKKMRREAIDLFNRRIKLPESFIDMSLTGKMLDKIKRQYDVIATDKAVGQGALALIELDNGLEEAFPFALNPKYIGPLTEDDFQYGLHQYVCEEAIDKLGIDKVSHGITLNMWQSDKNKVLAVMYSRDPQLTQDEIGAIDRLSVETPNVIYVTEPSINLPLVKINDGFVRIRHSNNN